MLHLKTAFLTGILTIVVVSCFIPITGSSVSADPGKIVPFVSVKEEYSDNVLFSNTNEQDDFITTATGGVVLSYDAERVNTRLDAKIKRLIYVDNDQLDATDGSARGTWDYQATERLGLGASAEYREDSRRDTDADTTGLILSGDRKRSEAGASASYLFTELFSGKLSGEYGMEEIDEINQDEDNDTLRVDLSFSRNMSKTFKNTTGLLNFSYLHYTSDIETFVPGTITQTYYRDFTSDVFQAYTGLSKAVTELYSV